LEEDALLLTTKLNASVKMRKTLCLRPLIPIAHAHWIVDLMENVQENYKKGKKSVFVKMERQHFQNVLLNNQIVARLIVAPKQMLLFIVGNVNVYVRMQILCSPNVCSLFVVLQLKPFVLLMGKYVL